GVYVLIPVVDTLIEADVIEDIEFRFRPPVRDIADPCRDQVFLGLLRHVARVPGKGFQGERIANIAREAQSGYVKHGIDEGAVGIRKDEHVALLNLGESAYARPVKADSIVKERFGETMSRN